MALQLSHDVETNHGHTINGNYWKILELEIDYIQTTSFCRVGLYKDATARQEGKQPMFYANYYWIGDGYGGGDFPFYATALDAEGENPQKAAYDKLKTLDEFTGATDV